MADRLTQLQDCLDDLATQMFASIRYIQTRHAFSAIANQPDMSEPSASAPQPLQPSDTPAQTTTASAAISGPQETPDSPPGPDDPDVFKSALRELARDLVLKEQQIEYLISVLPGIGESEQNQNQRIGVLERELKAADDERKEALRRREDMLDSLGQLAGECKRIY